MLNPQVIKALIKDKYSFAVYKLPDSENILIYRNKESIVLDHKNLARLNQVRAFVIAPFDLNHKKTIAIVDQEPLAVSLQELLLSNSELKQEQINFDIDKKKLFKEYSKQFNYVHKKIERAKIEKIVLSRRISFKITKDFCPLACFIKACQEYPNAFVYMAYSPITGLWLGASPELLLHLEEDRAKTVALAGTASKNEQEWSDKNLKEQDIVTKYILRIVKSFFKKVKLKKLHTVQAGEIQHLRSEISFRCPQQIGLEPFFTNIPPTPALCGIPKDQAMKYIKKSENYDREYYSGFVGPVQNQMLDLYVNIRCMKIESSKIRLFAGGGIIMDSLVTEEWEETEKKFETMLKILS